MSQSPRPGKNQTSLAEQLNAYRSYFNGQKQRIALSLCLSVLQTLTLIPIPLITKSAFDHALEKPSAIYLLTLLAGAVVLFAANAALLLLNRHVTLITSKSVIYAIRKEITERSLFRSRAFYATEDLDVAHSRIVNDTERLDKMTSTLLGSVFPSILVTVSLAAVLLYLNVLLFLIMLIVLPLLYLTGRAVGTRVRASVRRFHSDYTEYSKGTSFTLFFNELISLSATEALELEQQDTRIKKLQESSQRMGMLTTLYSIVQNNVLLAGGALVLAVGSFQVLHGTVTAGAVLSFYITLNLLLSSVRLLLGSVPILIEGTESLGSVMDMLSHEDQATHPPVPFTGLTQGISFTNVSFSHGTTFRLEGVSFTIRKGSCVGIFGASGSGKSTLVNLLLGFYSPDTGSVYVDENNLESLERSSYRRRIGVLPQDPLMFPGTIRENLSYGMPQMRDADMIAACRACEIHDFIEQLEHGYDTPVGNRSVQISGGQKQRIAIARALLRKPDLLILDEPDNNLDNALTSSILSAIASEHITVVLISHNPALRDAVDTILEIRNHTVHTS